MEWEINHTGVGEVGVLIGTDVSEYILEDDPEKQEETIQMKCAILST